ncbi:HD domain-containing protein [Hoeflea sp. Naph1]|uniref:HD domain-containing protein n=1 Tax=Hoeflea sp. Naph1 TaxID=3388653 RepID=UPI00399015A5
MSDKVKSLYNEIVDSFYFKRLHDISFLGIIDYMNSNYSGDYQYRYTRADHTCGVFELSDILSNKCLFSEEETIIIAATALCHDMGHGAFSHSLERAYLKINPLISHRTIVKEIVSGENSDVGRILNDYGVDTNRLVGLCVGNKGDYLNWIFHDPINVDTIDGIYRFFLSFKLVPPFDRYRCVNTLFNLYSGSELSAEEIEELDIFWESKGAFYGEFLSRGAFAQYEANFIELASKSKADVGIDDFFMPEQDVLESLDWDRVGSSGGRLRKCKLPASQFLINKNVSLKSLSDLRLRYERIRWSD